MLNKMGHRERVFSSLARKGYDRLPIKHYGETIVNEMIAKYFSLNLDDKLKDSGSQINADASLLRKLGDDFRYVLPKYCGPQPRSFNDGSREVSFPERGWPVPVRYIDKQYGGSKGTYLEVHYRPFENITDVSDLRKTDFPEPDWLDYSNIKENCKLISEYAVCSAKAGLDFINGITHGRGFSKTYTDIATRDPVYLKLVEEKFKWHYETTKNTLEAAGGLIDIVHMEEDLGSQQGPLINPVLFNEIFAQKYKIYFEMIHSYNAKTMLHSCGSVYKFIPRLIDIGLDILDVVQVSANNMDIRKLHEEFGRDLCFCGTIDVQSILINSSVNEIISEVNLRKELFSEGGLILGPSHAIQPGTPLKNIIAMYKAAGSLEI